MSAGPPVDEAGRRVTLGHVCDLGLRSGGFSLVCGDVEAKRLERPCCRSQCW